MPHISVKLVPGKSEEQKTRLAEAIVRDVMNILNSEEEAISVAMEEIQPQDWTEKVYRPDIDAKWSHLYQKPGYNPLENKS
jgi:4-oxalocrotonate tautomerase